MREDLNFEVAGAPVAAWLYRPATTWAVPCVVMAHGFGMTRECRLPAWAERFREAGLAVLLFDYRGFGASGGQPRQLLDVAAQRLDWAGAVAFARGLPGIDPERIALWGTSFSGGHVLHVGARDHRVAAIVAQVPFTDGRASLAGGGPSPERVRHTARLMADAARDVARRRRGGPPLLVPVAGELGSRAVIAGPKAERTLRMLVPDGVQWRNEVNAGVVLQVLADRPGLDASRIRCPLFVAVCEGDVVTPPEPAAAAAAAAPGGELHVYPFSHFEAYVGNGFEELCADELDFLRAHLLK
ncbi:MAG: alpha/beta hydrolase [Sporichthyaceae bacterium]